MQTHINRFAVGLGVAFGLMALVLATAVFLRFNFANIQGDRFPTSAGPDDAIMCTMEAKLCSDGSSVGRSGPKCEFAPCPTKMVR